MTRERLEQLWENYRDGTLSEADRAAFDDALRQDEHAAALFKAESQWLKAMAEEGAISRGESPDGGLFAQRVLNRWQSETAVVGRIGFARARVWLVGIAATIVAFIGGAVLFSVFNKEPLDPGKNSIVVKPAQPATPKADGVAMLLTSASHSYASAAAQPAKLRQTVSDAADMLDVNKLLTLLDPGVPDPARLTKPAGG